jgi:uncharacterized glyoxalase superfamily protein PhnB
LGVGMGPHARVLGCDPVLAVHDLAASTDWYARVLGCTVSEPDPGGWAFCKTGAVTFMLGCCPDALPATELGDHSYVAYLTVVDVDAFHSRALAEGAEILKAPTNESWGMREMTLRSPDGHRFMLGEAVS